MKKILSLLTLLLCVCSGAWADDVIFSAVCTATNDVNLYSGASDKAIPSDSATIIGGSMYVTNTHKDPQKYLAKTGESGNKIGAFCIATNNVTFKIITNQALQAGDKIDFILYSSNQCPQYT